MVALLTILATLLFTIYTLREAIPSVLCYYRWLTWSRRFVRRYGIDAALPLINDTNPSRLLDLGRITASRRPAVPVKNS
ncbi:MAG: hypothetical protein ABR549_06895 [Mycobacteriales bacterium]